MKENTDEKLLVIANENSIFYKIKKFFKNLFNKNKNAYNYIVEESPVIKQDEVKKNQFIEQIRKIDDEETILLKLQKQYRNGEIREEDLTDEQVSSLCNLYDKQIANLKKSNEIKKQKLLEYKNRFKKYN